MSRDIFAKFDWGILGAAFALIFMGLLTLASGSHELFSKQLIWLLFALLLIFGLPMIVFGVVFLLYTYDELVSSSVRPVPKITIPCSVCGKPTPRLYPWADPKGAVCYTCRVDASKGKEKTKKTDSKDLQRLKDK